MITSKMAFAFLDSMDCNSSVTDPDAEEMTAWLAMIFPLVGLDGFTKYASIPIVTSFLADPKSAGLEALFEELTDYYCRRVGHKTKPGVQIAALGDAIFYASVTVFPAGPDNSKKIVVANAREPNVYLAIYMALTNWKTLTAKMAAEAAMAAASQESSKETP